MGKMLKRLDNHLARSHKGVTRGFNDKQPYPQTRVSQHFWVRCQFPHCKKEVRHLSRHVKNIHSLHMQEYEWKFGKKEVSNVLESEGKRAKVMCHILLGNANKEERKDEVVSDSGNSVYGITSVEDSEDESVREHESGGENASAECIIHASGDDNSFYAKLCEEDSMCKSKRKNESVHENVIKAGSMNYSAREDGNMDGNARKDLKDENVEVKSPGREKNYVVTTTSLLRRKNGDKEDDLNESTVYAYDSDEAADSYNEGRLRYLVHNSSPDGLRYRQHLMNFYRFSGCYPFPEKVIVRTCLACNANPEEEKPCICPILPEEFYVYCRRSCPETLMCKRCVDFDKGASHKCIDFFHCQRCTEEYKSSTKFQSYPPGYGQLSVFPL